MVDIVDNKKEAFSQLPEVVTLQVNVDDHTHDINVLTDWRDNAQLSIELTEENLELVFKTPETPDGEEAPLKNTPTSIPGITFNKANNTVFFRVPKKLRSPKKRKHLSEKLDDTNEDSEERMERAARKLKKRVDQMLEQSDSSDGSSQQ